MAHGRSAAHGDGGGNASPAPRAATGGGNGAAEDGRFAQADREALYALAAAAVYAVWWYACAWGLGSGDPADYAYILGFPAWFFWSCLMGYPLACLLALVLTRLGRHVPLEAKAPPSADDQDSAA